MTTRGKCNESKEEDRVSLSLVMGELEAEATEDGGGRMVK